MLDASSVSKHRLKVTLIPLFFNAIEYKHNSFFIIVVEWVIFF